MKKQSLLAILSGATFLAVAAPEVSVSSVDCKSARRVKVDYTVTEDSIVTLDVLTNGVSIGAENIRTLSGDVNVRVPASVSHSLVWNARADWPDHRIDNLTVRLTAWPLDMPPWFMAVKINGAVSDIRYYADKESLPGGIGDSRYKTDYLLFRRIPAAGKTVRLGSLPGEDGRASGDVEKPHYASFAHDYYIGVYPVTQAQYVKVHSGSAKGSLYGNPSKFNPTDYPLADDAAWLRPVETLTYITIHGYNTWPSSRVPDENWKWASDLANQIGLPLIFDLPTEAKWEWACRGGTFEEADADAVAWYGDEVGGVTHPVGRKDPNGFDLYDMRGNVWEWCLDFYNPDYALNGLQQFEPDGPTSKWGDKAYRVIRGGGYSNAAENVRTTARSYEYYNTTRDYIGFRLAAPGTVTW